MSCISKPLTVLLLAAVALLPLAGQAFSFADATPPAPAGCHSDMPQPAVPAPVQHYCCHTGHSTAIVQKSLLVQPVLPRLATAAIVDRPLTIVAPRFQLADQFVLHGDPPPLLTLRI